MPAKSVGMPACHAFWVGPRLGPIHVACLRSVAAVGHPTFLHVYDEPEDAPECVTLVDASKLMPRTRYFTDTKTSYPSMFSDLFRYALLRAGLGVYVDCDIYCLKPIHDAEYIFGWESDIYINGAVLKLPDSAPLLNDLWEAANHPALIPPWVKLGRRAELHVKRLVGLHRTADLARFSLGPVALTWYTKQRGLEAKAKPRSVFYPIMTKDARDLVNPNISISDVIGPETVTLHCCSSQLLKFNLSEFPKGSIASAIVRGELSIPTAVETRQPM